MWWIFRWCFFKYSFPPFSLCAWTQTDPLNCPADPSFSCCFSASVITAACPLGQVLHVWLHLTPSGMFFLTSITLSGSWIPPFSVWFLLFLKSEFTFRGHKSENRKYPPTHTHTLLDAEWTEPSGNGLHLCWYPRLPSFVLAGIQNVLQRKLRVYMSDAR